MNSKVVSSTEKKHITAYELAKAFAAADIPINKLEHPQLRQCLEKFFIPSIILPSVSTVRKQLSVVYEEFFEIIKNQLNNKKLAVTSRLMINSVTFFK